MGELSLPFSAFGTHAEDRRLVWIVIASIVLHSAILLQPAQQAVKTGTQARLQSIDVSLHLLQQQEKSQLDAPVLKTEENNISSSERAALPPVQDSKKSKAKAKLSVSQQASSAPMPTSTAPQMAEQVMRGTEQDRHTGINEQYLAKLLRHIESFKFYPRMAQRRGIEGAVTVSFFLLANGEVGALKISGAHVLLQKAAQEAMQQAMPMLPAPAEVKLPLQISFVMQFQMPGA